MASVTCSLFSSPAQLLKAKRNVSRDSKNTYATVCKSESGEGSIHGRRQALIGSLALSTALAVPLALPANEAMAADIIERFQRAEFLDLLKGKLRAAIASSPDLVPDLLRLAINDALTYDRATKTGGANGSIRFSEEISRPENVGLEAALKLLETVKAEVDAESKGGPVSWADLIQFGGQLAAKRSFLEAAIRKAGGDQKKGEQLAAAFGSSSQWGYFDKSLGRTDAEVADPSGRVPVYSESTVADLKAKLAQYGLGARQVAVLSAFWDRDQEAVEAKLAEDQETKPFVQKYQKSRKSVSQTDYEVDLISAFTKLAVLGSPINYEAYTYVRPRPKFRF